MTSTPRKPAGAKAGRRRPSGLSAARLLAVQALYQMILTKAPAKQVIAEFLDHRLKEDLEGLKHGAVNRDLFTDLVQGVSSQAEVLDDMLAAVLDEDWTIERLEILLLALLRAAAFELSERLEVPARVVISEYVDLANAFFDGRETAFVNGMLDRLAHVLRMDEFGEAGALPDIS